MDILLIVIGFILMIIGLLGCILPALPGPPISYIGFLLLHFTEKIQFTAAELVVMLLLVLAAQVIDSLIPTLGSKYSGGTKWGSWGAFFGSIIGLFFLPTGIFLGPFLGAVAGELLGKSDVDRALKSGLGALLGFLLGAVLKFSLCMYFVVVFFREIFR